MTSKESAYETIGGLVERFGEQKFRTNGASTTKPWCGATLSTHFFTVDKEFLLSLDDWRMQLAQNIALRNGQFSEDELNFGVQQTIDRIIFLRIAEDHGVKPYEDLKKLLTGEVYYQNLFHHFREADAKYNSGFFDFKGDKLSASLQLDYKVIKTPCYCILLASRRKKRTALLNKISRFCSNDK